MNDIDDIRAALAAGDLGWQAAVFDIVGRIPPGLVLGYKDVGVLLGHPRRARHVGFALAALPPGRDVPWWRVLRSDGSVAMQGDPERGPEQAARLTAEGVTISPAGRVSMRRFRWEPWR